MNNKWTVEKLKIEASAHKTRAIFFKKNQSAYQTAKNMGIFEEICLHMPKNARIGKKTYNFKWDFDSIKKEALKYTTRSQFMNGSSGAYDAAKDRKILDEVCGHMPKKAHLGRKSPHRKWELENLKEEAQKYTRKIDFRLKSGGAYVAAVKMKVLDTICSHMPKSKNDSVMEKNLFKIISSVFPSTKKLNRKKIKIKHRPYIHGFEIDIYVPELRKGIEFDGKYYHSFNGLRRSRKHWPKNAICNYHQIKDDYFLSKGIKILHIKEEDWITDKDDCIKRCLEFLSNP